MGGQEQEPIKRRIHSLSYIRQMMNWGFDKEFIAKDMNITMASLETRLRRAKEREQRNGNQGAEPRAGSGDDDRARSQEG